MLTASVSSSVPFLNFSRGSWRTALLAQHALHSLFAFNALLRNRFTSISLIEIPKPVLATNFQIFLNLAKAVWASVVLD
jgi:hypothetical protein